MAKAILLTSIILIDIFLGTLLGWAFLELTAYIFNMPHEFEWWHGTGVWAAIKVWKLLV